MQHKAGTIDYPDGITAIDTEYVRPMMDASHLIVNQGRAAFVDTGTSRSVPLLLEALTSRGLAPEDVEYVLVTHVHLDDAGGAGELMAALPRATAVLHPRGARHMADPARLIEGSIQVYGEELFRSLYGRIRPIPEDRIRTVRDGDTLELSGRTLEFLHTEGHARHHYCILDHGSRCIFAGDSFGLSYRELDTDKGEFIFPSTTPVQFDPEAAVAADRGVTAMLNETHHLFDLLDHGLRIIADAVEGIGDLFVALADLHRLDLLAHDVIEQRGLVEGAGYRRDPGLVEV